MVPILADARTPKVYEEIGGVDFVFEDVADPEQARIMLTNSCFLNKGGIGMIAVKARCVDSTEDPRRVFARVEDELSSAFEIKEQLDIEPFEADHEFLVLEKK
jgi:fibrillarin-like rRNA methylase